MYIQIYFYIIFTKKIDTGGGEEHLLLFSLERRN